MSSFFKWLGALPHAPTFIWVTFVLLLVLLFAPSVGFLLHGWRARKDDILGVFSAKSAAHYLRCFHPLKALNGDDAHLRLNHYYDAHFGRRLFVAPLLIAVCISASLLSLCATTAIHWLAVKQLVGGDLPLEVVLAIMGAYMWSTNEQLSRAYRDDISPGDLYNVSFRFVIAVPMAYALSKALADSLSLPSAFLLGAFPTNTIMTVARRIGAKYLQLTDAGPAQSQLQSLSALDTYVAERFAAEGITTILELAYYDPVKLTIRTGLGFSYVTGCISEALLWHYVKDKIEVMRKYGLVGAFECGTLWERMQKPECVGKYDAMVLALATELGVSRDGFLNLFEEIATDPFIEFQRAVWGLGE